MYVYVAGISGKVDAHYPGRSVGLPEGYGRCEVVGRAGRSQQRAYYCTECAGKPEHEVTDHTLFSMYEEDTDSMTEMSDSHPDGTARNAGEQGGDYSLAACSTAAHPARNTTRWVSSSGWVRVDAAVPVSVRLRVGDASSSFPAMAGPCTISFFKNEQDG